VAIHCPQCKKDGNITVLLGGGYLKNGSTAEQVCPECNSKVYIDVDVDGIINTHVIKPRDTRISKSA